MAIPPGMDEGFGAMLAAEAAAQAALPPLDQIPPDMLRAGYRAQRTAQNAATSPASVEARDLKLAGAAGDVAARLYAPKGAATPGPLLVYFHGGGFVIGDLETHDAHCRRLADFSGARVLAVDYRLAPEHPFPASHDDALAATRWAFDHAAELGADPRRIGVGGDSAGGNLAASVALDLRGDPQRRLKFQLLLYPATWPKEETASRRDRDGPVLSKEAIAYFERHLAAFTHPQGHRAAPGQAADLSGLPPAFIATAGHDPLEHEGRDYALALEKAGVPAKWVNYPTLVHDFYIMGDVSPAVIAAAKKAGAAIAAALQES
ncbi:MAG TPA: alpha/beta hydrolase [Caulobacteraceae bacterium]|nr:alpha/beta hydrolase [Caulobacteraceae bacterium]